MNRLLVFVFLLLSCSAAQAQYEFYAQQSSKIKKGDTAGIRQELARLEKTRAKDTAALALVRLLHAELLFAGEKDMSGITAATDAIHLAARTHIDSIKGICHYGLGRYYYRKENLPASVDLFNKSLGYFADNLRDRRLRDIHKGIALMNSYMSNTDESLLHHRWLIKAALLSGDSMELSYVYNNTGIVYINRKQHDSAEYYLSRSLRLREGLEDKKGLGQSYNNFGTLRLGQERYQEALDYFTRSLELRKEGGAPETGIIESMINIGKAQVLLGRKSEALELLERTRQMAIDGNYIELRRRIAEQLKELYFEKGDFRKAFEMQGEYHQYMDSLYGLQKRESVMRLAFEQHAREDSISRAQKELQHKLEREKDAEVAAEREKKTLISVIALGIGLLLLGAISFVLYRGNLRRKKDNATISAQRDALEVKQKEIGDSISYARRIQDALLPSQLLLKQLFPAHFIFFRPRDVVSGDFYWAAQQDGKIFLAVADCTGHGVPGALMSMIGINFINRIVKEKGLSDPGHILQELHEGILATFSGQQQGGSEVKDGMDIALLCFDPAARSLSFSGAARPLLYADENGLHEVRADRASVGGVRTTDGPFATTTLTFRSKAQLYLFSDGFADQFGGGLGKKFKYAQLKSLLESLCGNDPQAQLQAVIKAFDGWKGELDQVDDVLLIGIQV